MSAIFSSSSFEYTIPVGLLGVFIITALVLSVIEPSSISAVNLELLSDNKDNSDEQNLIEEDIEVVEVIKPKKLWLKYNLNDGIIHEAVKRILGDYNGIDEVYVKDTATNKAYKMNSMVTVRESLIYELETILDKSCIFIQEQ